MTTHASISAGKSQCDLILDELKRNVGEWVSMLDLHRVSRSMAVHSRISDLRKAGHIIKHRNEHVRGACHSYYRLAAVSG